MSITSLISTLNLYTPLRPPKIHNSNSSLKLLDSLPSYSPLLKHEQLSYSKVTETNTNTSTVYVVLEYDSRITCNSMINPINTPLVICVCCYYTTAVMLTYQADNRKIVGPIMINDNIGVL